MMGHFHSLIPGRRSPQLLRESANTADVHGSQLAVDVAQPLQGVHPPRTDQPCRHDLRWGCWRRSVGGGLRRGRAGVHPRCTGISAADLPVPRRWVASAELDRRHQRAFRRHPAGTCRRGHGDDRWSSGRAMVVRACRDSAGPRCHTSGLDPSRACADRRRGRRLARPEGQGDPSGANLPVQTQLMASTMVTGLPLIATGVSASKMITSIIHDRRRLRPRHSR